MTVNPERLPAQPFLAPGANTTQTESGGRFIDIPFYLPIEKQPDDPDLIVIPGATPLKNPDSQQISFQTPRPPFGDFTLQGFWAWLAVVNPDPGTRQQNPLIFVEPDCGVMSSQAPLVGGAPPQFIGCQEGNRFDYVLKVATQTVTPINDNHSHTNYMLNPMSAAGFRIQPGAECELTIMRRECQRFFPFVDETNPGTVHLFFGLFGSVRYQLAPLYKVDSCNKAEQPLEITSKDVVAPSGPTLGRLSAVGTTQLKINKNHPADVYQLRYAGAEHLYMEANLQAGLAKITGGPIPARIFKRALAGGVLPQIARIMGSTTLDIAVTQPIVVPDQAPATGRFTAGLAVFGY